MVTCRTFLLTLPLLAIGFVGCSRPTTTDTSHPENPAEAKPQSPVPETPAAPPADGGSADFARALGVHCDDPGKGQGCIAGNMDAGDFYDIELSPSCGQDGFFAGVSEAEAPLLDTLPVTGSKTRINAKLSQGQFLCVQATARAGQQPAYYYVIAIPTAGIAACQGKPICSRYGDRQIDFVARPRTGTACSPATGGRYQGDCAHGWVDAQRLDVFSDGL